MSLISNTISSFSIHPPVDRVPVPWQSAVGQLIIMEVQTIAIPVI